MNGINQYQLTGTAAEMYERNLVPAIFEPFAIDLLEHAHLQPGERVLDVACGTGIVGRLAWPQVAPSGGVVGVDANPEMLTVAQQASQKIGADIEWIEGNVSKMPIPNDDFDVVLCQHGLQYFPDQPVALTEMRRVLGDHGRLILNVWRPIKFNAGHAVFAEVLERHVSAEAAATRRAPFKLSDREKVRALLKNSGFHDSVVSLATRIARFASAEAMIRIMMAGTPLGAKMNDADLNVLQAVIDEVTSGLSEYEDDHGLAIPMQSWVITAQVWKN